MKPEQISARFLVKHIMQAPADIERSETLCARALLDAHQRGRREGLGWQPIGTAPKDGREVLLWLGEPWSRVEKARWYEPWENWQAGSIPADPAREEHHGIGSALPTHWMPLPEPPAAIRAKAQEVTE